MQTYQDGERLCDLCRRVEVGFMGADVVTILVDLAAQVHRRGKAMAKFRTLCGAGHFSQVISGVLS